MQLNAAANSIAKLIGNLQVDVSLPGRIDGAMLLFSDVRGTDAACGPGLSYYRARCVAQIGPASTRAGRSW
jgi:hypothetical protein